MSFRRNDNTEIINAMKTAITLDTCIFENYNMNTETMLKHLEPILKTGVKFVLSEIVMLELKNHYETTYRTVSRSLLAAHKKLSGFTANRSVFEKLEELTDLLQTEKASDTALNLFISETKSEIIPYRNVTLTEIMDAYFKTDAPFRSGKKKAEFPDAIAVYSLDRWAAHGDCRIAAISSDNDWNVFAEKLPERWTCDKTIDAAVKRLGNGGR